MSNSYTTKQFIDALAGTGGIISVIAKRVGCDWHTAKKYVTEYPTVQRAYQAECETVADMAESTLIKSIQEGDVSSAKWWLSKIRKSEFGETIDVTTGGEKIIMTWGDNTDD